MTYVGPYYDGNIFFSYPVPPSTLNILSESHLPINGTMVSLQGTARLHPSVDTNVTVTGSWRRQDLSPFTTITHAQVSLYSTTLTFDPLRNESADGGSYMYDVSVTPAQSTPFIMSSMDDENYTLTVQPYPDLMIIDSLRSGVCMQDEAATLMGNVTLLPNTATSHTLSYTWTNPAGQRITSSNGDYNVTEGSLRVKNLRNNMGNFNLSICLDVPGTDIVGHCSSTSFTLSTDGQTCSLAIIHHTFHRFLCFPAEPGQVTGLVCSSSGGSVLSFNWTSPSLNADNVIDYVVEVTQYVQPESAVKRVITVTLTPPFSENVKPSPPASLKSSVDSGVGECTVPLTLIHCSDVFL